MIIIKEQVLEIDSRIVEGQLIACTKFYFKFKKFKNFKNFTLRLLLWPSNSVNVHVILFSISSTCTMYGIVYYHMIQNYLFICSYDTN